MSSFKSKGIDVYRGNPVKDWEKVRKAGNDWAIIRAGYGKGNVDATLRPYVTKARAAGLAVGVYWFSYAYSVSMAQKEAEYTAKALKGLTIDLSVYFDWEYASAYYAMKHGVKVGKNLFTAMNLAYCDKIRSLGYKPGIYFNNDYKNNYMDNCLFEQGYSTWYARFTKTAIKDYDIHQYASTGAVAGINGTDVDHNIMYKDLIHADKKQKYTGTLPKLPPRGYYRLGDGYQQLKDYQTQVKRVQSFINWAVNNVNLSVDGKYGEKTREAVKKFQKKHDIPVNGCFGNLCLAKAKTIKK